MSTNNSKSAGGTGIFMTMFLIFLVLKLTHNIDWSWWWVTAPIWIPFGIVLGFLFVALIVYIISKK